MNTILSLVVFVYGVAAMDVGHALAATNSAGYSEYKTDSYVVRISEGPGEMASIGSFAVHVYDSAGVEWMAGIIRPRDGGLIKSWVTRGDRNPVRIWVWIKSAGTGSYGELELLEFNGKALQHIPLPAPDKKLLQGYMGHDEYSVEKDKAYRRFPLYRKNDSNIMPTGGSACLELDVRNRTWKLSGQVRPVQE